MVEIIKINDSITIEIKKSEERTIVILNRNGKNTILSDLYTDSTFTSNVVYDNNYIVVYSKGDERNQIPIEIECAYNIKTGIILDTKNNSKLSDDLYMMLIGKKRFSARSIVILLNQKDLELGYEDETVRIIEYLTNGNDNISREEVVDYIVAKVKKNHVKRLQKGVCTVDLGYVLSDVLNNFERISDHCSNIGLSILESEIGDNFDSHEYISNLRSADSLEFKKRYAEYKEKYSI